MAPIEMPASFSLSFDLVDPATKQRRLATVIIAQADWWPRCDEASDPTYSVHDLTPSCRLVVGLHVPGLLPGAYVPPPPAEPPPPVEERRIPVELARWLYRFNRDQYFRLRGEGIIPREERVELIDGLVVRKPPRSAEAEEAVRRLVAELNRVLSEAGLNAADRESVPDDEEGGNGT